MYAFFVAMFAGLVSNDIIALLGDLRAMCFYKDAARTKLAMVLVPDPEQGRKLAAVFTAEDALQHPWIGTASQLRPAASGGAGRPGGAATERLGESRLARHAPQAPTSPASSSERMNLRDCAVISIGMS